MFQSYRVKTENLYKLTLALSVKQDGRIARWIKVCKGDFEMCSCTEMKEKIDTRWDKKRQRQGIWVGCELDVKKDTNPRINKKG